MTDLSRWQHFTDDEIDAITDALDYYIAAADHPAACESLYDELCDLADREGDDAS